MVRALLGDCHEGACLFSTSEAANPLRAAPIVKFRKTTQLSEARRPDDSVDPFPIDQTVALPSTM
jgi:hypothetical protein